MVNRVVSTKLSEEEHSKILEFCNDTGITVSSMVKQAIIERIRNEEKKTNQYNSPKNSSEQLANENQNSGFTDTTTSSLRFMLLSLFPGRLEPRPFSGILIMVDPTAIPIIATITIPITTETTEPKTIEVNIIDGVGTDDK